MPRRFRVTHPFHPWFGREFELVDYRHTWGEDRVYYFDEKGDLGRIPTPYTDARGADPFLTPDGHPKSPTCGHLKIPHLASLVFV